MAINEDKSGFGSPSRLGKGKRKRKSGSPSRLGKDKSEIENSPSNSGGATPVTEPANISGKSAINEEGAGPTDGGSSGKTYSRKSIAEGMKRLSKQGGLTPERIAEARGRATGLGVSDELFDKYMEREDLGKPKKPFGTGFGRSSGFGKAQPLDDRKSLFFKREARRARKKGYGNLAQDLYGQGIKAKMTEPTIMDQDYRDQQLRQREILAQTARDEDEFMSQMRKKLLAESRGSGGTA